MIDKQNKRISCTAFAFIFIFAVKMIVFLLQDITLTPDSYNYIALDGFEIFRLHVDNLRVPFYPIIIDSLQWLFGDQKGLQAVCVMQFAVSYISSIAFFKALSYLSPPPTHTWKAENQTIANLLFTVLYACSSAVVGWDKKILTESFSLSFTVFLIYFFISYLFSPISNKILSGLCIAIITLLGSFLRPTFSSFAVIAFGFFVLRAIICREERHTALKCTALMLIPIIGCLSYALLFYKFYGSFTLSDTWCTQQIHRAIESGLYKNSTDDEMVSFIDAQLELYGYPEVTSVNIGTSEYGEPNAVRSPVTIVKLETYRKFDRERLNHFIQESLFSNPAAYAYIILKTLGVTYNEEFTAVRQAEESSFSSILTYGIANLLLPSFSFGNGLLTAFLMFCIWLMTLIKRKECDWICLGCFGFILIQYVLSLFGTFAEFTRTSITVVPFVILSFFILAKKSFAFFSGNHFLGN